MSANAPLYPSLPLTFLGAGQRTDFGTLLPPGTRVTYVRSTGIQSGDDQSIASRLLTTINAACAECRSGLGDIVYVLPGHTESVTGANFLSNLVAGTRIIGLGDVNRDDTPTLTWTATTSQIAVAVKNVEISGMRLLMDGAVVVKAMNVTASGFRLTRNFLRWATGASNVATIAVEIGSGATDCFVAGNLIRGVGAAVTNGFNLVGATVPSGFTFVGNNGIAACAAGTGFINVTVAALNILIQENSLYNTTAASTACVLLANVASDGLLIGNSWATTDGGTAPASSGVIFGAASLVRGVQNFCVTAKAVSGLLSPVADA